MIYDKKLKQCENELAILVDKGQYLFYQLDKTLKTLRLINEDLAADRQAEDAYQSEREAIKYMEQRELERTKYGEREVETVADDILRAAGIDYKGERK